MVKNGNMEKIVINYLIYFIKCIEFYLLLSFNSIISNSKVSIFTFSYSFMSL